MIFLNSKAVLKPSVKLTVSYQDEKGKVITTDLDIKPDDKDTSYKIVVADNEYGIITYNCRIISYTLSIPDVANADLSGALKSNIIEVDTLKIDFSEDYQVRVATINVSDIRSIEKYSTDGFEEIDTRKDIKTFK